MAPGPPAPLPRHGVEAPPSVPKGLGLSHGYSEVRPIGSGSFGVATLVQDKEGALFVMKAVAISRLDHKQQADAVNEVKVLASLKHPYIVRYRESFIEKGTVAIVMDYAAGGDLLQRIREAKAAHHAFPESHILTWFTQATLGLKYLHSKQIIHRDLKSQNLFLSERGSLRIGDFGISKALKRNVLVGDGAMGTPYYLSPEICTDSLYSFASDMWALGCVLYELAVLKVPFEAPNFQALVERITEGSAPNLPYSYSGEMRLLCRDLLCRDPRKRPLAPDVIKRPFVQREISRLLREATDSMPSSSEPSPPSTVADDEPTAMIDSQQHAVNGAFHLPPTSGAGLVSRSPNHPQHHRRHLESEWPPTPAESEVPPLATIMRPMSKCGLYDRPMSKGGLYDRPGSKGGFHERPGSKGGFHDHFAKHVQRGPAIEETPHLAPLLRPPSKGGLGDPLAGTRAGLHQRGSIRATSLTHLGAQRPRHETAAGAPAAGAKGGDSGMPRAHSEAELRGSRRPSKEVLPAAVPSPTNLQGAPPTPSRSPAELAVGCAQGNGRWPSKEPLPSAAHRSAQAEVHSGGVEQQALGRGQPERPRGVAAMAANAANVAANAANCLRMPASLKPAGRDSLCLTRNSSRHHRIRVLREMQALHTAAR